MSRVDRLKNMPRILIWLVLLLLATSLVADRLGLLRPVLEFSDPFIALFQMSARQASDALKKPFQALVVLKRQQKNTEELLVENTRLRSELARAQLGLLQLKKLSAALNITSPEHKAGEKKLAQVIGYQLTGANNYLVINLGRRDGVKEGQAVLGPGNVLVGTIKKAGDSRSLVEPIEYYAQPLSALETTNGTIGLIVRGEKGEVQFHTDLAGELSEGALVLANDTRLGFIENLFVGQIAEVQLRPDMNKKIARLARPAQALSPLYVFVIAVP